MGGFLHRERARAACGGKGSACAAAAVAYYSRRDGPARRPASSTSGSARHRRRATTGSARTRHSTRAIRRANSAPRCGHALGRRLAPGTPTPQGALARVLLLDQFTRNIHRDTRAHFAGDARALAVARARRWPAGDDRELGPLERWFALPAVRARGGSRPAQERSLALFARLAAETGIAAPLEWAQKHAEVIRRFGRYPHRNDAARTHVDARGDRVPGRSRGRGSDCRAPRRAASRHARTCPQ